MKNNKNLKYLFFFPFLICILSCLPYCCFMDEDVLHNLVEEDDDYKNMIIKYIFFSFLGILIIIFLNHFFQGFYNPFNFLSSKDPYDMSIIYNYPNDGQVRPPQNPETLALESYFVIPNKPYFVNGEINYPLLNRDMLEFIATPREYPKDRAIPDHVVKWLEICYGYNITQDIFMNLKLHRELINPEVGMDFILRWVKWYYKHDAYRDIYSLWLFTAEEAAYYEGKDFYDLRIYPGIFTRRWQLPMV